jgi:hypothetical protein
MVMFFKEIGSTIRLMGMEIIITLKVQLIKEAGMKISRREKGEKNGQMDHIMRVNIIEVKNMDSAYFNGQMVQNIMVNGKIIRCMDLENLNGQMVEFTRVNIRMTKNMVLEYILGQMEECIKVNFKMENSTERVLIDNQTDKKYMECGKKAKK